MIFNSRKAIITITSNLLFVLSFMQFQLSCVHDVIFFYSKWSEFLVHSRDKVFGRVTFLTLKNDFHMKLTFYPLIQRYKVQ